MKKLLIIQLSWLIILPSIAQNQSDGNTPLVPVPLHMPATESKCKDNLVSFYLPCSSDHQIIVKNVARMQFSGACRHEIVFYPPVLEIPSNTETSVKIVTATYDGFSIPASIVMVNSGKKTINKQLSAKLEEGVVKTIEALRQKMFQNTLANSLNGALSACSITGNKIPKIRMTTEIRNITCTNDKSNCVVESINVNGQAEWRNTISCQFPVFGIPFGSTFQVNVTGTVNGELNIDDHTSCLQSAICKAVDFKVAIGGNLTNLLLDGVRADLKVAADSIKIGGQVCVLPLPVSGCAKVTLEKLRVIGNVQFLWGLISNKVNYIVYDGYNSPSLCF